MKRSPRMKSVIWISSVVLFGLATLAVSASAAQVQTTTTTSQGEASKNVTVENGEVVWVSGNSLIVKMADGSLRHFDNVPESARVTVDGQELGIHDLKPGMKLQRTITTTSTPETIKTVQTVTGRVWNVNPPLSVILTLEDGTNQQFRIPRGQMFNINGQMVDAWGLRRGMNISATRVVETPRDVITRHTKVTGVMPPAPPAPAPDLPVLVAEEAPTKPVETAQAAPAELPKTGSPVPLIGLIGLISLASALGLRAAFHGR